MQIAEYKQKKAITEDLLANADLDYGDEYGDDYAPANEEEGENSLYIDQMRGHYAQRSNQRGNATADIDLEAEL